MDAKKRVVSCVVSLSKNTNVKLDVHSVIVESENFGEVTKKFNITTQHIYLERSSGCRISIYSKFCGL